MKTATLKKTPTLFRPSIFSRHPSHNVLRAETKNIRLLPHRSVVRLGSTTDIPDTVSNGGNRIEINTIQAIKNSASKLLMKQKFIDAGVKTAPWTRDVNELEKLHEGWKYPIVAKSYHGSKGRGNTLIKSQAEFDSWNSRKQHSNYLFERFLNYFLEYRLHVTEDGCFYACRKALKKDVPEEEKWHRHDDNCVWFLEDNQEFFKPNSWDAIVTDCVNALKAIGADVLSFDVKVQMGTDKEGKTRRTQDYILLECNSASSMDNGTGNLSVCAQKYIEEIPKIILRKASR